MDINHIKKAVDDRTITAANGESIDKIGNLFAMTRDPFESDFDYCERIIDFHRQISEKAKKDAERWTK